MTAVAKRNVTSAEAYTGRFVDLMDPKPEQISLADIAQGLSAAPRFGGQISRFYSVAEHSVRCAEEAERMMLSQPARLATLFHDAHEAYTGDIIAPVKQVLLLDGDALPRLQHRLDVAIAAKFELQLELFKLPVVKLIDDAVMFHEAAGLKYSHGIGEHWGNDEYYEPLVDYGWSQPEAARRFIETYERLTCRAHS